VQEILHEASRPPLLARSRLAACAFSLPPGFSSSAALARIEQLARCLLLDVSCLTNRFASAADIPAKSWAMMPGSYLHSTFGLYL